jgi:hypothetical protein
LMTSTSLRRSVAGQLCGSPVICKDYAATRVGVSDPGRSTWENFSFGENNTPRRQALPKVGGALLSDARLLTGLCEHGRQGWKT